MKKRQRKKNQQKYLPIYADETNLLTMTDDERIIAWNNYLKFREQYAYCKSYRELKIFYRVNKRKMLFYSFPVGEKMSGRFNELFELTRYKSENSLAPIKQSLTNEKIENS